MNRRLTISTAVALGAAFALAPIAGQAAMAAPVATHSVQAPAAASKIEAPIDISTERENNFRQLYFDIGQTTQIVKYAARPGAQVTAIVNGKKTSAKADANGIASVPVTFERINNQFDVYQTVKRVDSTHTTYGFFIY
jgi:hypothetical protein